MKDRTQRRRIWRYIPDGDLKDKVVDGLIIVDAEVKDDVRYMKREHSNLPSFFFTLEVPN